MKGEGLDDEIDVMDKIVKLALREMEVYEKYSDDLFEEAQKTTTPDGEENSDSSMEEYQV